MQDIDFEVENAVAVVRMQRPPVNALSNAMYRRLLDVFQEIDNNDAVRCVVFASGVKCFTAGADLHELREMLARGDASGEQERRDLARELFTLIRGLRQPVIAAVGGPALGAGAVLAACCDIRVADGAANFGLPEINAGRCGGGRHLMRVLPQGKVRQLYFTGNPLTADEAYRLGMVDVLCSEGDLDTTAMELARLIASKSASALRLGKAALDKCEEMMIDEGYMAEQGFTRQLAETPDALEAVTAFAEHRPPVWERA
jgi:enoyl-CoA hydratase